MQGICSYALIRSPRCDRPNKPSAALAHNSKVEAESKAKTAMQDKKLKGQANLLTRIPSLRYRFHPYQRDDRVRQAAEAGEVERVRVALGRSSCVCVYSCMCVLASRHIRFFFCRSVCPWCNDWHSISVQRCAFSFSYTAVCRRTLTWLPHRTENLHHIDSTDTSPTYNGWKTCSRRPGQEKRARLRQDLREAQGRRQGVTWASCRSKASEVRARS